MRVLVSASRAWTDWRAIAAELHKFPEDTVVIHGGGGSSRRMNSDQCVAKACLYLGLSTEVHVAEWETPPRKGDPAGPIRNRRMLNSGVDVVLAFWDGESPGTWDVIKEARRRDLTVYVHRMYPRVPA